MNTQQVDIQVTGRWCETVALVEVRNVPRLTLPLAEEIRRGLLEDDGATSVPVYFLIVSQENAFLWQPEYAGKEAKPATEFSMREVLREYLTDRELAEHLRGAELEIAVMQWLSDMSRGRAVVPAGSDAVKEFAESLHGGTIHGGTRL